MARHWLFKSEPGSYSWSDLVKDEVAEWDGVRNFTARNLLRDEIKTDDLILFYHSNSKPSAIIGIAKVVKNGYPDHTAWQVGSEHPDPKSSPENPIWYMVDISPVKILPREISLTEIKSIPDLSQMVLVRQSRLSVQPVTDEEYDLILKLAEVDL